MATKLSAIRAKYNDSHNVFLESDIAVKDPYAIFKQWMDMAIEHPNIKEPNAAALATVDKQGCPSNRFVLLKDYSTNGFTFFTNYESRKAKDIENNPNVAMTVYWQPLHRSVRIEGKAEKVPKEESIKYFHERPRDSQISAKASPQSQRIPDRATLKNWEAEVKAQLKDGEEVPTPNWGGYLIRPHAIEFWQGQSNRLHDRIRFICGEDAEKEVDGVLVHKGENGWVFERLAP